MRCGKCAGCGQVTDKPAEAGVAKPIPCSDCQGTGRIHRLRKDGPVKVLVVDDDTEHRDVLAALIQAEGFDVVTAVNGRDALAKLQQGQPDCIILDLVMPQMDGWQFREQQLRHPAWSPIPTVVITGITSPACAITGLQAESYLLKPINPEVLTSLLQKYCA